MLLLLMSLEVDAQSTMDDDESRQSLDSRLEETVIIRRNNAIDSKQIKEQLAEVIRSLQEIYNGLDSSKAPGRFKVNSFASGLRVIQQTENANRSGLNKRDISSIYVKNIFTCQNLVRN